jgi:hypothetical protein
VNRIVSEGIDRAASRFKKSQPSKPQLIAWDWGWNDSWSADAIVQLPSSCALMSVSEWSLPIERGGVKSTVGEYSISSIGPGPRAKRHWEIARKRGLKVVAKIQAGNSWELSAVPYIPALENVAQHAVNLRAAGVENVMLGWTLGGFPSPNIDAVQQLLPQNSNLTVNEALQSIATQRFGKYSDSVLRAWHTMSAAFREFPFHGGVVYSAPQQVGPANLLFEKPTNYRATMVGFPYDDLNAWRAVYPPQVFTEQFEKVAQGFSSASKDLARTQRDATGIIGVERKRFRAELSVTKAAELHFRSVVNQARFVIARSALGKATDALAATEQIAILQRLLEDEIELAKELHRVHSLDSRVGFEATNHYYYVPVDLVEKVINCRDLLDRWLPTERAKWNV